MEDLIKSILKKYQVLAPVETQQPNKRRADLSRAVLEREGEKRRPETVVNNLLQIQIPTEKHSPGELLLFKVLILLPVVNDRLAVGSGLQHAAQSLTHVKGA